MNGHNQDNITKSQDSNENNQIVKKESSQSIDDNEVNQN